MTKEKAKGGRGKKAENPYERITVSLHPDTVAIVRQYSANGNLSISETVDGMILLYSKFRPIRTPKKPV